MKCPACAENTPDAWRTVYPLTDRGMDSSLTHRVHVAGTTTPPKPRIITLDWMRCANPACEQVVIRSHATRPTPGRSPEDITETWLVYPRASQRPLDPLVDGETRADYQEAAAILDLSPRMSALLSRRVLADLLKRYARAEGDGLAERIDAFVENTRHPSSLRESLQHFRESVDFGTRRRPDGRQEIVNVGRDEAEWTLDILDRLFDHFVVAPAKDRRVREAMERKIHPPARRHARSVPDARAR